MPVRWIRLRSTQMETYCILHFTSFSIGIGFECDQHELPHSDTASTHLFNFLGFEDILKNFEVGDELILMLSVHLNSRHLHVA